MLTMMFLIMQHFSEQRYYIFLIYARGICDFLHFWGVFGTKNVNPVKEWLIQTLLINGRREYLLQRQQQLFDEVPVRLVLLAPFKGGNVRTKER